MNTVFTRVVVSILVAATLPAQESPGGVFRVETRLMQVEVRVRAKNGDPVRDLAAEDFYLAEDGIAQTIVSADFVAAPLPLAILEPQGPSPEPRPVRSSGDQLGDQQERTPRLWVYIANQSRGQDYLKALDAIDRFVRAEMVEGMSVSIGGTPFTEDRRSLLRLVGLMRANPNGLSRAGQDGPVPRSIDMLVEQLAEFELERESSDGSRAG